MAQICSILLHGITVWEPDRWKCAADSRLQYYDSLIQPLYFILTVIEMNMIEWEDVNLIRFAENSEH